MPTFMPPRKHQRKKRSKKLRGKKRRLKNIEKYVPKGMYCYGFRPDGKYVHPCPFLRFDKKRESQSRGICEAFGIRDDYHWGLLWDWVKECDVNEDWDNLK